MSLLYCLGIPKTHLEICTLSNSNSLCAIHLLDSHGPEHSTIRIVALQFG
jgi:hypothetical protein